MCDLVRMLLAASTRSLRTDSGLPGAGPRLAASRAEGKSCRCENEAGRRRLAARLEQPSQGSHDELTREPGVAQQSLQEGKC